MHLLQEAQIPLNAGLLPQAADVVGLGLAGLIAHQLAFDFLMGFLKRQLTGRTAIYTGSEDAFDDGKGHVLVRDVPLPVCDKTAGALSSMSHPDLTVTASTWHYAGGGCC